MGIFGGLGFFSGGWEGKRFALSALQFAPRHLPWLIKAFPLLKDSKKLCKKEQVRCFVSGRGRLGIDHHIRTKGSKAEAAVVITQNTAGGRTQHIHVCTV